MGPLFQTGATAIDPQLTTPIRIQLRRSKGWKMPENTVKVDRTTKWGNPFADGAHFRAQLAQHGYFDAKTKRGGTVRNTVEDIRRELAGRNLACWCALPADGDTDSCHAAILLQIANTTRPVVGPGSVLDASHVSPSARGRRRTT
jgi:uncharacterized protein DUF4326